MKLPQDLRGNPTIAEVKEGEFEDLPEAIKDFLDEMTDDEQDFKNMVQPICHELPFTNQEEVRKVEESFRSLGEYHTHKKRVDVEPYLLPQKDGSGSYNTTTNCVFHLRYGSSFQAQVKYFNKKELQDQLFELVLLENGSAETRPDLVNQKMQEKSRQSLRARFRILTENLFTSTDEEEDAWSVPRTITSPEDVRLCDQVKEFAGKTELHIGNGNNSAAQDRLALQKLLKKYTLSDDDEDTSRSMKQKIAAMKSLVVYVPSTLLYGGAEILELPGTNDSDPLVMGLIQDALDTVDSVLLLSEFGFRIAGQEVKDCLTNSDFIKKWKNNSNDYKLMFLSYPEKNHIYQFGESDCEKIENIAKKEPRKKSQELQEFEEILKPDCLTADMKNNIRLYTLLPVLHSSIHALKGEPHHIVEKKRDFLKYTGIDLLTSELDRLIMQKKKNVIEEIEKKLEDFEACRRDEAGNQPEDDSPPTAQEMNFDQETKFLKKNEDLFNTLKTKHEDLIKDSVDGSRKMDDILFGDLDEDILPIFSLLIENLHVILNNYKKMAIELFTKELKTKKISPATVGRSLECALGWFLGTTRASFNESTLMKSFQALFKDSMEKHILDPSYRDSIETTKRNLK
ncbi:uncharacterized protein [Hyperolius riggenbachi]|uniref:uncharacterized protein n=1 Tax=Hyperolius riggenbachi TaxID=752182 RepID=UPI0035A39607